MNRFQISDLSFCEVVGEKETEIKGGLQFSFNSSKFSFFLLPEIFSPYFFPTSSAEEVISETTEYIVKAVENPTSGESGYIVSDKLGIATSGVIQSQTSITAFSFVSHYSAIPN